MRNVAVLLAVSGTALSAPPAAAQKTREQVRADAASAARAGQIAHGELTAEAATTPSVRTRPEVKAETRAAVKAGAIDHGEVTAPAPAASDAGAKSRAEVRAEAASALHLRKPAASAEVTRK